MERVVTDEIQKIFPANEGVERIFFPEKSGQIPDRPILTFVILAPSQSSNEDPNITAQIDTMIKEHGTSARTYKNALMFIIPELASNMRDEARKLLAWTDIKGEGLSLEDSQNRQLDENIKKAHRDLRESVWRAYNKVLLLGVDNSVRMIDLGLVTSSAAENLCRFILNQLRQTDEVVKDISPRTLVKNWPPAFTEWSTKVVRDAFYASPLFPRLLNSQAIKDSIVRGVSEGHFALVGKNPMGGYTPFFYKKSLSPDQVEIDEDLYLIKSEEAEKHIKPPELARILISPSNAFIQPGQKQSYIIKGLDQFGREMQLDEFEWSVSGGQISKEGVYTAGPDEGNFFITAKSRKISGTTQLVVSKQKEPTATPTPQDKQQIIKWYGEVPALKWMNFYSKVLTKFVRHGSLKISVSFETSSTDGFSPEQVEELKGALRELGLKDGIEP